MIKLKDLLEKKFNEIDFKSQKAFAKYNGKHKMRKSTKVNIGGKKTTAGDAAKNSKPTDDVGGPAHPNVPKGAKSSKDAKKKMDKKSEKEISKIEKNMMKASNAANDKMDAAEWLADKDTVEKFNDMVDNGKEVTFDTDEGTFTLLGAEGGMFNSALATNEKGEEVEIRFDDIKRIDSPDKPLSGKEELKKWAQQDKEAMDKYGDYIDKEVAGDADNRTKMSDADKKRLARDLMNKDFAIPGTKKAKERGKKLAKSMGMESKVPKLKDLLTERRWYLASYSKAKTKKDLKKIVEDNTKNPPVDMSYAAGGPMGTPEEIRKHYGETDIAVLHHRWAARFIYKGGKWSVK